jgi:hypothetical protein
MNSFLLVGILSIIRPAFAEPANVTPQINKETGTLMLLPDSSMNKQSWHINNWKKQQRVNIAFPDERTPAGHATLELNFETAGGGCNIISTPLAEKGKWRLRRYGEASLWLKGNCDGKPAKLVIQAESDNYTWEFKLDKEKWTELVLSVDTAFTRAQRSEEI